MSKPNIESNERAVIGAVLRRPEVFHDIDLQVGEFSTRWRRVYSAVCDAVYNGDPVDPVTLSTACRVDSAHIAECMRFCTDPERISYYADAVRDNALDRRLRELGRELQSNSTRGNDLLALAQQQIALLGMRNATRDAVHAGVVSKSVLDIAERRARGEVVKVGDIELGLPPLDDLLALVKGNVATVAGRPSMGKSAFMIWVAIALLMRGERILLFSTEATRDEVIHRIHALLIGVSSRRIAQRRLQHDELADLHRAHAVVSGWPLWIDDQHVRLRDVERQVRRYKARENITQVIVDHLQELSAGRGKYRLEGRAKIDVILEGLRDVCRESPSVLLWLVSQLHRGVESREDKRPFMSDLKESGKIEEISHMIFLLYRAAFYYQEAREKYPWKLQVAVAKSRNGPTGRVLLHWDEKLGQVRGVYDEVMDLWEMAPMHGSQASSSQQSSASDEPARQPKQQDLV